MTGTAVLADAERSARDELRSMSNWGRWGDGDERGAANLVTGAAIARGMAAVQRHEVYELGAEIRGAGMGMYHSTRPNRTSPKLPGVPQPVHYFSRDGADLAVDPQRNGRLYAEDTFMMPVQGAATHVDALCHVGVDGQLYNGFTTNEVRSYGARHLGIDHLGGLVTRGVFLDMARHRGVDVLEPDDYLTEDDIVSCCEAAGVTIEEGDAVLVRTGWPSVFADDPVKYGSLQPGVGSSAALHLARRGIAVLGSDNSKVQPYNGYQAPDLHEEAYHDIFLAHASAPGSTADPRAEFSTDLHDTLLRNLGVYLLEMLDLEAIARAEVSTFLFVMAPLRLRGASGSPVNPLAVA